MLAVREWIPVAENEPSPKNRQRKRRHPVLAVSAFVAWLFAYFLCENPCQQRKRDEFNSTFLDQSPIVYYISFVDRNTNKQQQQCGPPLTAAKAQRRRCTFGDCRRRRLPYHFPNNMLPNSIQLPFQPPTRRKNYQQQQQHPVRRRTGPRFAWHFPNPWELSLDLASSIPIRIKTTPRSQPSRRPVAAVCAFVTWFPRVGQPCPNNCKWAMT